VLPADHLPELGPDLVAALPALDVQDLPHLGGDGGARAAAVAIWSEPSVVVGIMGSVEEDDVGARPEEKGDRSGWGGGRRGGKVICAPPVWRERLQSMDPSGDGFSVAPFSCPRRLCCVHGPGVSTVFFLFPGVVQFPNFPFNVAKKNFPFNQVDTNTCK
jgi:hypothetical protein